MNQRRSIRGRRLRPALAVILALGVGTPAFAAQIPGGQDASTDCFAEFQVFGTATQPPGEDAQVACTD